MITKCIRGYSVSLDQELLLGWQTGREGVLPAGEGKREKRREVPGNELVYSSRLSTELSTGSSPASSLGPIFWFYSSSWSLHICYRLSASPGSRPWCPSEVHVNQVGWGLLLGHLRGILKPGEAWPPSRSLEVTSLPQGRSLTERSAGRRAVGCRREAKRKWADFFNEDNPSI